MKKGIPKGLSWRAEEATERDTSRPRLRTPGPRSRDELRKERPPAPPSSRRIPRRSVYSVQNPGHVDRINLPQGLRPPPGTARPRSVPAPRGGSPSPPPALRPAPAPSTPPTARPAAPPAAGAASRPPPAPTTGGSSTQRPTAPRRAPSEPGSLELPPFGLPAAPRDDAPKPRTNTVQGHFSQAPTGPPPSRDPATPARPAGGDWRPSSRPPLRPAQPGGTLMGHLPPRISSTPPASSPGGTLHGVDPPAPDGEPVFAKRPTAAVPNTPRSPDGTLLGCDAPEPLGEERPTARPPRPDPAPAEAEPPRSPDGTLLGFDGPRGPRLPRDED